MLVLIALGEADRMIFEAVAENSTRQCRAVHGKQVQKDT